MQFRFDASQVAPQEAFEPLPASWYTAIIVESSERTPANDPRGKMLEFTLEILGGDYNKRKIFDRLNVVNGNAMAVDIAYRTLSAICHATGVIQMNATEDLHGKPLLVKVARREARTDQQTGKVYEANNEVKGYKAVDPNAPPVLGPPKATSNPVGNFAPPAWATGQAPQQPMQSPPPGWAPTQNPGGTPQGMQQSPQTQNPAQGYAPQPQAQPTWSQPQQPQQYQPAQGFVNGAGQQHGLASGFQVQQPQTQFAGNLVSQPSQSIVAVAPQAPFVNTTQQPAAQQTGNGNTPPWQAQQPAQQPAANQVQPQQPPNQVQQPQQPVNQVQQPGGTPPWATGGQPGAQPPQTPPWQQGAQA